jgi:hypothetical protein
VDLRRARPDTLLPAALFSYTHTQTFPYCSDTIAPLELDWCDLYRTRSELDRRWNGSAHVAGDVEDKENAIVWEPRVRRLLGHNDR